MENRFTIYTKGKKYYCFYRSFTTLQRTKQVCDKILTSFPIETAYIIKSSNVYSRYNLYVYSDKGFFKSNTINLFDKHTEKNMIHFCETNETYHKIRERELTDGLSLTEPYEFCAKYKDDFIFWLYEHEKLFLVQLQ